MKNIILLMVKAAGTALSIFTLVGVFFDLAYGGKFYLDNWMYTKMAVGTVVISIGFSVPTVVYESERLSYGIKVLIHMGTGCAVMLVTGFAVGWIPKEKGIAACVVVIAGQMVTAFALWAFYAWQFRQTAKKMNEKIEQMNKRGQ